MQVYEICTWLSSLDPDNINSIKTLIKDTIHIFMSSHGQTGLPVNNVWHQRENIAFAWSLCCLSPPLPLIEAAEKKDINQKKKKRKGCRSEGKGGAASCCLATSLQGDKCACECRCVKASLLCSVRASGVFVCLRMWWSLRVLVDRKSGASWSTR